MTESVPGTRKDSITRSIRILIGLAAGVVLLVGGLSLVYPPLRHPLLLLRLSLMTAPEYLPVPVDGVGPHQLENTWGAPRSEGRRHEGIDIFAPRDTPVRSTTEGIVIRKGWNRRGGRRVTILGPEGYTHYYAHLEAYADLDVGDDVEEGEIIGYVGDSGNAINTPTHLHYGIYRPSGPAVNPYPILTRR